VAITNKSQKQDLITWYYKVIWIWCSEI